VAWFWFAFAAEAAATDGLLRAILSPTSWVDAVQQRAGEPLGSQHGMSSPRTVTMVESLEREDLKQQLSPGGRQRDVAELVNDEQLHRCKIALELEQAPVRRSRTPRRSCHQGGR